MHQTVVLVVREQQRDPASYQPDAEKRDDGTTPP
jgi:hypothetical protein